MVSHRVSSKTASWAVRARKLVNGWFGSQWRRLPLPLVFSGKLVSVARLYLPFAVLTAVDLSPTGKCDGDGEPSNVVVLPAPFGPSAATSCPSGISKLLFA